MAIKFQSDIHIVTPEETKEIRSRYTFRGIDLIHIKNNKYFLGVDLTDSDEVVSYYAAPPEFWDMTPEEQQFIIPDIIHGRMQ